MSKEVEQRIVEMRFDNKQFENNASDTMSTLDKLKQKLNFRGASKGLDEVNAASRKIDMGILSRGVEAVQARFSAMQVVAVTALANITNSAINTGRQMISALTIDPIMTGFQEYETQINAVQTILANTQSKGSSLSDVNAALGELNKYADQTIYNFTEMTRNIGTFTAAGVDLDKSVSAIKGIANLAAVSGSTSQQASTAMYQLSQALAAGKVQLMDWNSVVNAGMGGELFQTALKRTATQMGHNVDSLIKKYGSFRESLTKGNWLTAEVLTETLTQLSGAYTEADLIAQGYSQEQAKEITQLAQTAVDAATKVKTFTQLFDTLKEAAQSGWTETWEILVGDFEEAKDLLTELSGTFGDIIGKSAEARNTLLYDALASNWKKITDGLTEAGLSAEDFKDKIMEIGPTKEIEAAIAEYGSLESAFKNGALSSSLLNDALLKMTGTTEEISKKTAELRGEYKTNKDIIDALTKAGYQKSDMQNLLSKQTNNETIALNDLSDAQLMSIGYTAEQVKSIRQLAEYSELAGGSLKGFIDNVAVPQGREMLVDTLRVSLRSLISVFEAVGKAWDEVFPPMSSERLLGIIQGVRDFVLALRPSEETLSKIQRTFRGLFSVLDIGRMLIIDVAKAIFPLFSGFDNLGSSVLDTTASLGDWLFNLRNTIKESNSFGEALAPVSKAIQSIRDKIGEVISNVKKGLPSLGDTFSTVFSKIKDAFNVVKDVLGKGFSWIKEHISIGDIFAGLAGGGIFVAVKKFSGLVDKVKETIENLFSGGGDGGSKFSEILGSVHDSLESFQEGIKVASLVGIAVAVGILTSSLRTISEIKPEKVAYSLLAIQLMIMSLNSGFRSLSKTISKFNAKGTLKASIAMMAIATAVNILADAMIKFSDLSLAEIAKGLVAVAGSIGVLSVGIRIIGKGGVTLRTSVAILALAAACRILSDALISFSSMSWDEIGRGLVAMGGALAIFTASLTALSKAGGFGALLGSAGILVASQSLDEISENLERLGNLSWDEIGRGLTAMGIALGEFTVTLGILSKAGGFGALLGGTAILVATQSLDEISENLERLGNLSWDEIGRGLVAMGGALAELGVVSGVLGKLTGLSGLFGAGAILLATQSLDEISENLKRLGNLSWDEIGRGLVAMGGALTELGVVAGLLGKLTGFSGILGAGAILLGVQGLGDLADALKKFGSMSWDEIGRGLVAMGGALTELGVISGLLGTLAPIGAVVGSGSLLLGIQGLGDLADALKKFGSMDWDEIGRGLTAMGGALSEVALGGIINTLSGLGAGAIAKVAEPLGTLADSVKKWTHIKVPEGLGAQLSTLAGGVTSFTFGGFGASAIAEVAAPLGTLADSVKKWIGIEVPETLGPQLSNLAGGVNAFTFGGLGASAIAGVAEPLGTLADSIRNWLDIEVPETLGAQLSGLANGVNAFTFSGFGANAIEAVVTPLANLSDSVKKWIGIEVPNDLGAHLSDLAGGTRSFIFADMGASAIDAVTAPLANLADSVKKWVGIEVPETLGSQLSNLAGGVTAFTFGGLGASAIAGVAEPLGTLAISVKKWADTVVPENMGAQLSDLASGVLSFTFGGMGASALSSAAPGIGAMADAVRNWEGVTVPEGIEAGLTQLANGVNAFSFAFMGGWSMGEAVGPLSDLADAIRKWNNVTIPDGIASKLSELADGVRSFGSTFVGGWSMGEVTGPLGDLAGSVKKFEGIQLTGIGRGLSGFADSLIKLSNAGVSGLVSNLEGSAGKVSAAVSNLVSGMASAIDSRRPSFKTAGQALMTQFVNGISGKNSEVKNAISKVTSEAAKQIESYRTQFYNAGSYVTEGFISGMSANMGSVKAAARRLANGAYESAMKALDAHSPSKLFGKVGMYTDQGFANGIDDNADVVSHSAVGMAEKAVTAVRKAILKISDTISREIDTQPVIRPVLDLTGITSKASRLNTLVSQSRAYSIVSDLNEDTYSNQNGARVAEMKQTTVQFTQNNYSPKALTNIEIYRQTKNLFSEMERTALT